MKCRLTEEQKMMLDIMMYFLRKSWWILLIAGIEFWGIIATLVNIHG